MRSVPIKGYVKYRIYEDGRIWCCRRNRFKYQRINWKGYPVAVLYNEGGAKNFFIHRLVYEHFVAPIPKNWQINHKDGIKNNNHFSNLEIVTAHQNLLHAYKLGLITKKIGEETVSAKLFPGDILKVKELRVCGWTQKSIATLFGIDQSNVSRILSGKTWKHLCAQ